MSSTASVANIPVISITADCLPQAWEKAVLAVWDKGFEVKTQYDKPQDPPSKDATVMVTVTDPFNEPRIHKNFPGGPEELESYRQEVVNGIHDHWIDRLRVSGLIHITNVCFHIVRWKIYETLILRSHSGQ